MGLGKPPAKRAPWPPLPSNDKFYRYPLPYPVGKKKENFATVAQEHKLSAPDLIRYNFLTTNPDVVNWYLGNYIRCPEPLPGVKNYSFEGAVHDAKKHTGVIFIPMYGQQVSDYVNRLGAKVVENYNKSDKKEPGGSCFRVCHARVQEAARQVGGAVVPDLHERDAADPGTFSLLWGSHIGHAEAWKKLPVEYRGKGAAGAMAWAGMGALVDSAGIWSGKLKPGAVLQAWVVAADFDRVRDGKEPTNLGHSFIFLNYVYKGSAVTGLVIADQGYQSDKPLVKGDYGYWVGANLVTKSKP